MKVISCFAALLLAASGAKAAEVAPAAYAIPGAPPGRSASGLDLALHGFVQAGYASRVTGARPSNTSGDFLAGEERLQLALSGAALSNPAAFSVNADFFHD